ncbi:hypothetical protein Taro_029540 [Colocasia esculenta]|uniref:Uncharacterized protein n=1 Tax=Colocasia esculenta TaxID=4460 RepID=A0A843VPC3_COLES|nr:hypothetical protein [Colocasia esculenta]
MSTVRGGFACGPSTLRKFEVAVLVFPIFGVPAALAGEGLVIPIGPCSRGSPPYFLQLGARCRGSSVSDGLRRRLWRRVLSVVVRASVVSSCTESVGGDATFGVLGGGPGGRVVIVGVRLPCMIRARAAGCSCCCAACVASVVARRVCAVEAWLALDSLAVVFPV